MDADAVVGRDPRRKSVRDELRVDGSAHLLPVVVRTGAAGDEAEPVAHARELRPERVGHAGLEPADHAGAPAREQDAGLPGLAQNPVEAVHAPDREHVRRVPAADEDHVLGEHELAQARRRPGKERDVRGGRGGRQQVVEAQDRRRVVADGGGNDRDPRLRPSGEADDVGEQAPGPGLVAAAAAEADDLPLRHEGPV